MTGPRSDAHRLRSGGRVVAAESAVSTVPYISEKRCGERTIPAGLAALPTAKASQDSVATKRAAFLKKGKIVSKDELNLKRQQ